MQVQLVCIKSKWFKLVHWPAETASTCKWGLNSRCTWSRSVRTHTHTIWHMDTRSHLPITARLRERRASSMDLIIYVCIQTGRKGTSRGMHISFSMKYYWIDLWCSQRNAIKDEKRSGEEIKRQRGRLLEMEKRENVEKNWQKVKDMMKCLNKFAGKKNCGYRPVRESEVKSELASTVGCEKSDLENESETQEMKRAYTRVYGCCTCDNHHTRAALPQCHWQFWPPQWGRSLVM